VPAGTESANTIEILVARLHECHEVAVYEAIERLVQAAKAVGFDAHALVQMLDQGETFEEVLEAIESRLEDPQKAA